MRTETPDECPVCGADVPSGARACPQCGSDESTGWSDKARYDAMGVPDDDESFNYEEFVEREFAGKQPRRKNQSLWITVALILLLALTLMLFGRIF